MEANPSTYKQVIENMKEIQETILPGITSLGTRVNTVETTINNTITNPPTTGDITSTDKGIKVVGITVVTSTVETDTGPATYTKDITYEIKKASVLGLTTEQGFTDTYCVIVTYKNNDAESISFTPVQLAYNSTMNVYYRKASTEDATVWSAWDSVVKIPEVTVRQQIIDATAEPTDQKENEYWIGPVSDS